MSSAHGHLFKKWMAFILPIYHSICLLMFVCLGWLFCFSFVCLSILKTVSFVAQVDLELEIILHLSPPVLDFPGCTIMPGNVMLEIKYRASSTVGKRSTNLATSPVLTEHFGKASWTVSLLYPPHHPVLPAAHGAADLWTSLCCPNETVTHSCTPWLWFLLFLINCSAVYKVLLH